MHMPPWLHIIHIQCTMVAKHHICMIITVLCDPSQYINFSVGAQTSQGQIGRSNLRERFWNSGGRGDVDSRDTASFHVHNIFEPQRASGPRYSLAGNSHRRTGTKTEVRWSKGSAGKPRQRKSETDAQKHQRPPNAFISSHVPMMWVQTHKTSSTWKSG